MSAPAIPIYSESTPLAAAAFGDRRALGAAELPVPRSALDSWHRAVILGGGGHYAAARAELRLLRSRTTDPVLLSLAASTEGSLLRQLGWHARAAVADGRAAALVLPTRAEGGSGVGPDRTDAVCDALTGLAADALGTGRLTLATRLLWRSHDGLDPEQLRWRPWVRWHWVSAETALASGRADPARTHAEAAVELAERGPSIRHRIKSRLLVAAAAAAGGDAEHACVLAEAVAAECREYGLLPLRWACAMLRAGVSADADAATAAGTEAAECAAAIARRGGRFRLAGVA
ncbi:hypothetical protein [Nocardia sp. NBC_01009]|uniref:hypothetical protein n=1 Tax=Nocardia sp. NBC_01009 TaxID=2975996 RepID=UPI00386411F4|nr:hypothetical protein OHA42_10170 [Nocardia sp. NBC_01009]